MWIFIVDIDLLPVILPSPVPYVSYAMAIFLGFKLAQINIFLNEFDSFFKIPKLFLIPPSMLLLVNGDETIG